MKINKISQLKKIIKEQGIKEQVSNKNGQVVLRLEFLKNNILDNKLKSLLKNLGALEAGLNKMNIILPFVKNGIDKSNYEKIDSFLKDRFPNQKNKLYIITKLLVSIPGNMFGTKVSNNW